MRPEDEIEQGLSPANGDCHGPNRVKESKADAEDEAETKWVGFDDVLLCF
jgi:hypothetical protein